METPQLPHLPQSFPWATISLAHLGRPVDSLLTWRVLKDSKKNEGLSGAAVFSDSVIMPLKILIVLAVCIRQWPQPTRLLRGGKGYLGFDWRVLPHRPEMRVKGNLLIIKTFCWSVHRFACTLIISSLGRPGPRDIPVPIGAQENAGSPRFVCGEGSVEPSCTCPAQGRVASG